MALASPGRAKGTARRRLRKALAAVLAGVRLLLAASTPLVSLVAAAPGLQPAFPEGRAEYFAATGHYVKGPFLDFFHRRGGIRIFGYPQTEVFYDSQIGLWVQYFDNVRMEWHPQNPAPQQVQLGLLGELLGHRYPPISPDQAPRGDPFRQYFPQTGHTVSYAFLVFYDQYGGPDIFGYPISEPMVELGRIVQYFQHGRMEWRPERPRDDRVVMGALGLAYLQRFGVPEEYRRRQPFAPSPTGATALAEHGAGLQVQAFVREAITDLEGFQSVYIYAIDALHRPVSGAMATVSVRLPSQIVQYSVGPTDHQGIVSLTFPISALVPGQKVVVDVTVQTGDQQRTAQTCFMPWY